MNLIFMQFMIVLSFAAQCAVAPAASDEEMARLNERRSELYAQRRDVEDWAQHLDELKARLRQKWDDADTPQEKLESHLNETLKDIDEEIRDARQELGSIDKKICDTIAALTGLADQGSKKQTKDSDKETRARMQLDEGTLIESSQMGVIDTPTSNSTRDDQESPPPLCEGSNESDQELSGDEENGARSQLDDDKNSDKQRGSEHGAKAKQSARNKRKKRSKKPKPKATPSHVVKKEDIIKLYTCDKAVKESATAQQQLIKDMQNDLIIINDLANGRGDERIIYTNDEVGILSPSIYVPLISHISVKEVPPRILEDVLKCYIEAMSRLDASGANVFEAVKKPNRMGDPPAWFTIHHEFMSRVQKAYDQSKACAEMQFKIPSHKDVVPISFAFLRYTFEEIVRAKIDQLKHLINDSHFREEAIEELQSAQRGIISTAREFFEHCKEQDLHDDAMYVVFADFKDKLDDFNILMANLNVVVRIHHWRKKHHGMIAVLSPLCCEHLDINGYLTSMHYESSAIQRFKVGAQLKTKPFPLEDTSTGPVVRGVWYDKRMRFTSGKQLFEAQNEKNNVVIIMKPRHVEGMQEAGRYSSYTEMDLLSERLLKDISAFIGSMNFGELQKADKEHCRLLLSRILWTLTGCKREFVHDILRKMAVTMSGKKEFVDFERLVKMGFGLMKMMVSKQKEFVVLKAMQIDGINGEMLDIIFAFIEACIKKSFEIQLVELKERLEESEFKQENSDLMGPYFKKYRQIMRKDPLCEKIQRLFEILKECRVYGVGISEQPKVKRTLERLVADVLDGSQTKAVLTIAHILYEHKERSGELRVFIAFNSEWNHDLIQRSLIAYIKSMGYERLQINFDKVDG